MDMDAVVLPFATATFRSPLPRPEIASRLRRLASNSDFKVVDVEDRSFKLVRRPSPFQQFAYLPVWRGRLIDDGDGTRIRMVTTVRVTEVLMLLLVFGWIVLLQIHWGHGLLLPIILLFFVHTVGLLVRFRPGIRTGEDLLARLLDARRV